MKKKQQDYGYIAAAGIMICVALRLEVGMSDILSKKRNRDILEARQLAIYLTAKTLTGASLAKIGSYFGLEHGTVLHAIKKVEDMLAIGDTTLCVKFDQVTGGLILKKSISYENYLH